MGTPLGPKYIPYTYLDPLGNIKLPPPNIKNSQYITIYHILGVFSIRGWGDNLLGVCNITGREWFNIRGRGL